MPWRQIVTDLAWAFKWDLGQLLSEPWDELLAFHAEIDRINEQMGHGK